MKITQKQLVMLYEIAVASASIVNPIAFDQETRQKLLNDILNQQDNENIVELSTNRTPSSV